MASAAVDDEAALQGRDLPAIFRLWEEKLQTPGFDPVPILTRSVSIIISISFAINLLLFFCARYTSCHVIWCIRFG